MKKFLITSILVLCAVGAVLFLSKDLLLKAALGSVVKRLTGFDTSIRTFRLEPGKGIVALEGLTLLNPYRFEERIFADIPEIYLQVDFPNLIRRRIVHIQELKLNIREINVEKDPQGTSNILAATKEKEKKEEKEKTKPASQNFYLDRLELTLRKVSYRDRTGIVPRVTLDMRIEKEVLEGINDPQAIVNLVLMKVVKGSPIGNLGLSPQALKDQLDRTSETAFAMGDVLFSKAPTAITSRAETAIQTTAEQAKERVTGFLGKLRPKSTQTESSR